MSALTDDQKQRFDADGFLIVPGVLTADQMRHLRAFFRPRFGDQAVRKTGDTGPILLDSYNRFPEVRWLLFHPPTTAVLRDLLGPDFVVVRESPAHHLQYGGWHKDTSDNSGPGTCSSGTPTTGWWRSPTTSITTPPSSAVGWTCRSAPTASRTSSPARRQASRGWSSGW